VFVSLGYLSSQKTPILHFHIFNSPLQLQHSLVESCSLYQFHIVNVYLLILKHLLRIILLTLPPTFILCTPKIILIFNLKVLVEAFFFCTVLSTSTYGTHPLDFTNNYLCLVMIPINFHIHIISMVLGMRSQQMITWRMSQCMRYGLC